MNNRKGAGVLIAGLWLTGVGFMVGCGGDQESPVANQQPAVVVAAQTAVAEWNSLYARHGVTGSAAPWRQVSPGTKLMGRITRVPVQEGDRVTEGQVLAEMESRDLVAGVDQATARRDGKRAELMAGVTIRPMTRDDIPALRRFDESCRRCRVRTLAR